MHFFSGVLISLFFLTILLKKNSDHICFSLAHTNALKGICVVGIVLHHCSQTTWESYGYIWSEFTLIGSSLVSIYFFLSGYGLISSIKLKGKTYLDNFFSKRLKKILFSFIIATILWWFLSYLLFPKTFSLYSLIINTINGGELLPHSWFVVVILIQYILFYFTQRYINQIWINQLILFIFSIFFIVVLHQLSWGAWWYVSTLAFNAGMIFKLVEGKMFKFKNNYYIVFCVICILILVFFYWTPRLIPGQKYLAHFIFPIIAVLTSGLFDIVNKYTTFLGSISYEIYLFQCFPAMGLRSELIFVSSDFIWINLTLLLSIILGYLMKKLIRKFSISINSLLNPGFKN